MSFEFYRQPRVEQLESFERAKDAEFWAHFWDPRVGKSKEINDQFRYNVELGRVTALVVIAFPSKVHLVWRDEAPKDFPPEFLARTRLLAWRRGKMSGRRGQEELQVLLDHDGPVIFTMNCEAILTTTATNFLRKLFTKHKVMLVVDEDWATSWSARTKRLLAMGRAKNVAMRRLLTGTPVDEGYKDLYFPTTFLKPGCLGFTSAAAFRARYTEYEQEEISPGVFIQKLGYNRRTGTNYPLVKGYQNLDELNLKLKSFSDRVERHGSERVYSTRYFEMTGKQRQVYDSLRDEYLAQVGDQVVEARDVLLRMTRLQCIARNYYPPEKRGDPCSVCLGLGYDVSGDECPTCGGLGAVVTQTEFRRIDDRNPAAEAIVDELRLSRGPFVIWAAHIQEVVDAFDAARTVTDKVARYDGTVPDAERDAVYRAFRDGTLDGIVATERSSLSRGHDLRRAKLLCYYTNEWGLRHRRQSEARGDDEDDLESWTDVVDLVAEDTRDLDAITALREKRSIAQLIMGDKPSKWI
jgi:hypothetical protein